MTMPSKEEFETALAEAARMREEQDDPHFIAKTLLNLKYQKEQLEHVLNAAEMYFHSGMAVAEHQKLKKAIDNARSAIERTGAIEHEHFGLR